MNDKGDQRCDVIFLAGVPSSVVCLLVLPFVGCLNSLVLRTGVNFGTGSQHDSLCWLLRLVHCMEHARQRQVSWPSIANVHHRLLVLLVFVRLDDGVYFVVEQVVKQTIGCANDDISEFHLNRVLIRIIGLI